MLRLVLLVTVGTIISTSETAGIQRVRRDSADDSEKLLKDATDLLTRINNDYAKWSNKQSLAEWNYASNLTEENLMIKLNISTEAARFNKLAAKEVNAFPWHDIKNETIKRQFMKLSVLGTAALPEDLHQEYEKLIGQMENIYSKAKICAYNDKSKCNLSLEPEIVEIVTNSRDPQELKYIWTEWRKVSGEQVKSLYPRYVELSNLAATLNNYSDNSAYWLKDYEADDFPEQIEALWQEIKPFYLQLHAYVRRELRKKYGEDVVSKDGPIPAHLLGNVWAQQWENILDFTIPFPMKKFNDVSSTMVDKGYNATHIFRLAEDFFVSINLTAMPELFWKNSILEKPNDREIVCHASAWDFYDTQDFRIKQCTRVNMDHLLTAHHEMGHVEYFLQYKDQPVVFREGANPGFHEAIGDVIALSASTPSHLKTIGLLNDDSNDKEMTINHLYLKSLEKIVFLPFAYMMDKWRWNVFQGKATPDNFNCHWWMLAEEFQGIEPPVDRSEEDFDPGAKYHIVADVEYLRYFVSHVIQFQFHKTLCTTAKQYDPQNVEAKGLNECDIYNSKEAGNMLKSMLQLGSSKPWQDAIEQLTGQRRMSSEGLLEYFKPLIDWLKEENQKTNEYIGWKPSVRQCVKKRSELPPKAPVESNIFQYSIHIVFHFVSNIMYSICG